MPRTYPEYAFGRRLLTDTLSDLTKTQPDRVYASVPKTGDLADGYQDVSFSEMERMSSAIAGWIEDTWGRSSEFETIAYIGVPDLRNAIVFFAALRSGYKLFLPSPQNPPATNASLLETTKCSKIIHAQDVQSVIDQISHLVAFETAKIAPFVEILRMDAREVSRSTRSFDEAKNDPVLILHSSGSTGLPKAITMTNGTFAALDNERLLPTTAGRVNRDFSIWDFEGGGKFYTIFPYFHLAGFLSLVINPVFTEASTPVLGPTFALPTAALMKQVLDQQKVRALHVPPSIAEQLLAEPDGIDYFKKLDFVCYTGGPFSHGAGEKLVQVTNLVPLYSSTEAFQMPQLVPDHEDWAYMEWNPHCKHEMQPAEDGASELVIFADESTEKSSALNHNMPGTSEFRTRDLFKPHLSKPNLWQYYGRRDDIVVFSNGEKYNPVPMELMVGGSPLLSGALVIGNGRTQASLFLEPNSGKEHNPTELVEEVWPLVERANSSVPAQGCITRTKVHVVPPGAFVRAGDGTVIRRLSEKKLQEEVDELYTRQETPHILRSKDEPDVESFVADIVADVFSQKISIGADLFAFGLDSLKSAEIMRDVIAGVKPATDVRLSLGLVYRHSTIKQLSEAIHSILSGADLAQDANVLEEISALIEEFTRDFPQPAASRQKAWSGLTVALTGSNGALGTGMLKRLLKDGSVSQVYCLNRRHDEKHERKFKDLARFFKVQLHEEQLGLDEAEYKTLLSDVDVVIHNSWQVDFVLPLKAFRGMLQGVRGLIDLNLRSAKRPRLVFHSSASSAVNWPRANRTNVVPETIIDDHRSALETGYGASKQAAEHVLASASQQRGVEVVILRTGQVVQHGDFSLEPDRIQRSWVAGMLQTSKTLGCFPEDICDLDWLTLDEASAVLSELSLCDLPESTAFKVLNVVNPTYSRWADVLALLHKADITSRVPVPLADWIEILQEELSRRSHANGALPSARLLPFFRALGEGSKGLRYETQEAKKLSHTLRSLPRMDRGKVEAWMKL